MLQEFEIYTFVNPNSGSRFGNRFIEHDFEAVKIKVDGSRVAHMHIINLTNKQLKEQALKEMAHLQKHKQHQAKKLIMTVAGGDGTLMFLAKDAVEAGCKIENLTFCILPYGTGNDLAQTLGWGA